MSDILNFNPALPESRQFTPPAGAGNGAIHKPGEYQNPDLADPQPGAGKLGNEPYRHAGRSLSRALKPAGAGQRAECGAHA